MTSTRPKHLTPAELCAGQKLCRDPHTPLPSSRSTPSPSLPNPSPFLTSTFYLQRHPRLCLYISSLLHPILHFIPPPQPHSHLFSHSLLPPFSQSSSSSPPRLIPISPDFLPTFPPFPACVSLAPSPFLSFLIPSPRTPPIPITEVQGVLMEEGTLPPEATGGRCISGDEPPIPQGWGSPAPAVGRVPHWLEWGGRWLNRRQAPHSPPPSSLSPLGGPPRWDLGPQSGSSRGSCFINLPVAALATE